MTPQRKLKLLLIQQFLTVSLFVLAIALVILFSDYGTFAALALVIGSNRLAKRIDNPLKHTDVRLTPSQKHIYFGAAVAYFLAVSGWLLRFAITHSRPPVWALFGLVMLVVLVMFYAHADSIYGSKSQV
jgi:hypothetical protein